MLTLLKIWRSATFLRRRSNIVTSFHHRLLESRFCCRRFGFFTQGNELAHIFRNHIFPKYMISILPRDVSHILRRGFSSPAHKAQFEPSFLRWNFLRHVERRKFSSHDMFCAVIFVWLGTTAPLVPGPTLMLCAPLCSVCGRNETRHLGHWHCQRRV